MMGLKLSHRLALQIECDCCEGYMGAGTGDPSDHAPSCPRAALQRLYQPCGRHLLWCPECHAVAVEVNTGDFFECRECATQYSRGITPGHDPETLKEHHFIDEDGDEYIPVRVLPEKGDGEFRFDKIVEKYTKQIEVWRARKEKR